MRSIVRVLSYLWPLPYTLLGVAVGLVLGGQFCCRSGAIEIHGPIIARGLERLLVPAAAITLGHVILGRDLDALNRTRAHEHVHVRQYERWGVFFVPAYGFASIALILRGRDGYRENPFEVEAFESDRAGR